MISGIHRSALLCSYQKTTFINTRRSVHRKSFRDHISVIFDNPLPLGAGALVVGLLQLKRIRERETKKPVEAHDSGKDDGEQDLLISCYQSLPLRHVSRAWGFVNNIYLPKFTRNFLLGSYARAFKCDLSEAEEENLENYENLGQFFRRSLKAGCRTIDPGEVVVSPCDGRLLHKGEVTEGGLVEQVKGVSYSLQSFLGHSANIEGAIHIDQKSKKDGGCSKGREVGESSIKTGS